MVSRLEHDLFDVMAGVVSDREFLICNQTYDNIANGLGLEGAPLFRLLDQPLHGFDALIIIQLKVCGSPLELGEGNDGVECLWLQPLL